MLFSYMITWAKKHDAIVLNPSFLEYKNYFRNFKDNTIGVIPDGFLQLIKLPESLAIHINESFKRISYRKIKTKNINSFDLSSEKIDYEGKVFEKILSSTKIIFFDGFLFGKRNFNFVREQREYLKNLFEFTVNIQNRSNEILDSIEKPYIVGICMRQGDYKDYLDGKFYLEDNEYKVLLDRIKKHFDDDIGIFVACEEKKKKSLDSGSYFNYGDPAVNIYTLSKCDYLIGPASTFMTWAGFLNNVPACYIDRTNYKSKELVFSEVSF